MGIYELFFNALFIEYFISLGLLFLFGAWKMSEIIFDDKNGYGFNIFDEIEKHEKENRKF